MSAGWDQAKKDALAVLGSKGKLPDPKVSYIKAREEHDKLFKTFEAAVDVLQAKILALENSASANRNSIKQYQETAAKSTFGLDKNADKDKIAKAQDILSKYLDFSLTTWDKELHNLDELNKHATAIDSYKPQP